MVAPLEDFLRERFDADELRRFLGTITDGKRLVAELPSTLASHASLTAAANDLLERRGDARARDFYVALLAERPLWPVEIVAVAAARAVTLDLDAVCEGWERQGRVDLAANLRSARARVGDFAVVETRSVRRKDELPGLPVQRHADAEPPATAPRVRSIDWQERYRRDIADLVLDLQGVRAVKLLQDLARTCDVHDHSVTMLGVRLQLPDDRVDRQDLYRQILVKTDEVLSHHRAQAGRAPRSHGAAAAAKVDTDPAVLLRGENLTKRYAGAAAWALRDVTLTVPVGALVGVVGPNSAGKSTLLNLLAGSLAPSSGALTYPGFAAAMRAGSLDWSAIRRQIRHVPQRPPRWSGRMRDNLRVWAACLEYHGERNDREVDYVLERMDLAAHGDKTWGALSGGVRMRFELARAWIGESNLLVLDEPLAPLDARMQHSLLRDLRDYTRFPRRPAVVFSAQNTAEIEAHLDLVVCLDGDGQALYVGPPRAIARGAKHHVLEVVVRDPEPLRDVVGRHEGCVLRVRDGVVLIAVPVDADEALAQIRAHTRVGVDVDGVRDISSSVRLLFWEGSR